MAVKFNPFTGQLQIDEKGSGGGSAFFAGEVATYADLPLDGTAALNSRWLVRSNSGTWPFSTYKQAGVYVRTATGGTDRDADYDLTDTSFHDVMSDDAFLIFDNTDPTKAAKFDVGANVSAGQTRTLSIPNSSGTIALTAQLTDTQVFTANGTWTKPAGAKMVHAFIVSGGGGGGSGPRQSTASNGGGGGGGAGGSVTAAWIDAASLGSTETVTVGSGGAGGPNRDLNNFNGANGNAGGDSSFGTLKSIGGQAGAAGTSSAAGGGHSASSGLGYFYATSMGRGASGAGSISANATAAPASFTQPAGAGGGGGKQSTTYYVGGNGGGVGSSNIGLVNGGTASANNAGGNGGTSYQGYFGTGGAGGSPGTGGEGNAGGNGGLYGAGGGGGSAADNDAGGSTAGGNGGQGLVIVTTYF